MRAKGSARHTRRAKPGRRLSEAEREYFVQAQLDRAAEPWRILRFEFWCLMIGGFIMMSPILVHNFFPSWGGNPFAAASPVAIQGPGVAFAVLVVAFLLFGRRKPGETTTAWLFRSFGRAPLYLSTLSVVMILTGAADLQRRFDFGRHAAALIDARGKGSQTSPILLETIALVFVGLLAAMLFIVLYTRIVVEPSWLYQHALREEKARLNTSAETAQNPVAAKITKAIDKTTSALYRVRLIAAFMYAAIGTSAYLYFAFGRQRYLHDPVASSFGLTAYTCNLILVVEGFRAHFVGLWYGQAGTTDAQELSEKSTRILTWSLKNAAAALVYVWMLSHGGLDKGADLLTKHIIPGWSRLQAWALSNVLVLVLLSVFTSVIGNRIDRALSAKRRGERVQKGASQDRRERAAALLRKRSSRP